MNRRRRSRARRAALQAVYQWTMTDQPPAEIERQFVEERDTSDCDADLFSDLIHGVPRRAAEIDAALAPHLDRPLQRVDPVERAMLRLGLYELLACPETPWRVVLDEYIALAKKFGSDRSYAYVNAALERAARDLRRDERRDAAPAAAPAPPAA